VGKKGGGFCCPQRDIEGTLIRLAREGKNVVRLKGGDPFIFGRGGEELDYLRRLNVKTVVVPGITAALGCAAAAGIPLTHRDHASGVVFVTGHRRDGVDNVDWRALATPDNTIIVYMGLERAALVQERLIDGGLAPSTPVAIIERGTTPEQRISYGTLDGLGRLADEHRHARPALLVIGDVVALGEGWAQQAPLREAVSW
jgi:uroporphyrin-III C-methyltransferase/precorrin-2 dehydrogenase/sirohydrochlorin ferrochelatase